MNKQTLKTVITGLAVGIAAPLVVEYIKKRIKKAEKDKEVKIDANTDHSFVAWVGDDGFFEIEGDNNVSTNPFMSLVPLTSKERMRNYPVFKKYKKFSVTPAKKVKVV